MSTPMHPTSILTLDEMDKKLDQTSYRGMIASLLYLTANRLDIMFSVCLCSCFQSDPRESYLTAIKRIFRYLKGTTNLGLCYKKSDQDRLKDYNDVDFAGYRIGRKNTNGGCHFIGANLISWSSKRQDIITLSTTKHQLEDYDIIESNISLLRDNTVAINLSKNPILHSRAKHIEIKHHFIRDYVQKGILDLKFINTENQLTDIFTKPLPEDKLVHIGNLFGVTFIL
ncbi:Copia protein, partial [Mucuna pruriens]